ncbi:MAG: hypothetical protein A2Z66_02135 [Chloroflexi bacterium RBG_13_66_10]|nr:MAG: hypothetical protein A2Z66_02135 [Chloroflexi bacterium RBG_13_66_10]
MDDLERFRREKGDFFRTNPSSPLTAAQRQSFTGLRYFPPNPGLRLMLEVEEFPVQNAVQMQTTTGDVQSYERFGRIRFEVDGIESSLTLYHNEYGFFLPFADSLAGKETYGAGRYLEPEPLPDGRLLVDFNLAYNPYCAYNEHWSCPITPAENRLKVPIRAGEMTFELH